MATGAARAEISPDVSRSDYAEVRLMLDHSVLAPGRTAALALEIDTAQGWHTYWRNPGDSGLPTEIVWTAPEGVEIGPIQWPAPRRLPVGPFVNYGYKDWVALISDIRLPADWPVGQPLELRAEASWLVCEEICLREDGVFTLTAPTGPAAELDAGVARVFMRTRAGFPEDWSGSARYAVDAEAITLRIEGAAAASVDPSDAYFFAATPGLADHAAPQPVRLVDDGLTIEVPLGRRAPSEALTAALDGVLVDASAGGGGAWRLSAAFDPTAVAAAEPARTDVAAWSWAVLGALLFGVLGGLILNLMPCVFPVLALKAVSLAAHADHAQSERMRQGVAYGAGVLTTFLAIGALLIGLKAAGAAVGWGFQLQSPVFVALVVYALFAIGLNLSGVFEAPSWFQNMGSTLTERRGRSGSFFTGALAVAVASPCTAPYMAASMGFALSQNAVVALLFFLALGVGFAAPLVALSASPALARLLPKPGAWMVRFKQALAFPMYLASAYFLWVFTNQVGPDGAAALVSGLVLIALAGWALGVGYPSSALGRRVATGAALAALLGALVALTPAREEGAQAGASSVALDGVAYDPAALRALRAEGRTVFLNVTADWCISCKYNERVVLSDAAFATALSASNALYMEGDWTRPDDDILALLESFGRSGVPLYVVYRDGAEPEVLPQFLSQDVVARALEGR